MGKKEVTVRVNRKYKDTLFRMIYSDKRELLSLYNAVNGTTYDKVEDLEIITLENAIYINMKNDLAFIIDFQLYLYEHQSTYNPNIPLRDLFYVAKEYEALIDKKALYGAKLIKIPTPSFIVFYNGREKRPEREVYRLSDAFEKRVEEPNLELKVQMININAGNNTKVKDACKTLRDYCIYVEKVRDYAKKYELQDAVERAVDECIKNGVLESFLKKYRGEAIAMSIFECNEEEIKELLRQDYREEGLAEGRAKGLVEGRAKGLAEGRAKGLAEGRAEGRAKGRAEGRAENMRELVQKKLAKGKLLEVIAEELEETVENIQRICHEIEKN